MPVYREKRTDNYTVMSNHHLRNKNLSLKAKGLMSMILTLREDWIYSLKGLECICREGIDAIRSAMNELEREGYITRSRERDGQGKYRGTVYVIREQPLSEKPALENPILENPTLENPTQSNTKEKSTDYLSNTHSIPFNSAERCTVTPESNGTEMMDTYEKIIKENIEYELLSQRLDKTSLDELVTLMVEMVCTNKKTIHVAKGDFPAEVVKSRLLKLDSSHIEYVLDCLNKNTTEVRNIKQYLLTTLFNAPSTMDNYYSALVNHDLYDDVGPP